MLERLLKPATCSSSSGGIWLLEACFSIDSSEDEDTKIIFRTIRKLFRDWTVLESEYGLENCKNLSAFSKIWPSEDVSLTNQDTFWKVQETWSGLDFLTRWSWGWGLGFSFMLGVSELWMHYANEGPHKYSTDVCVLVCMCRPLSTSCAQSSLTLKTFTWNSACV